MRVIRQFLGRQFVIVSALMMLLCSNPFAQEVVKEAPKKSGGIFGQILGYYIQGGFVMHLLLACSIIATVFILERGWAYFKAKTDINKFMNEIKAALLKKDIKQAVALCDKYNGPVPRIIKAGLLKFGQPSEEIEKAIEGTAVNEIAALEKFLPILASISNIAPILGFLGTVVGMIISFDVIKTQGLNDPGAVAGGISTALITTAGGLIVAVFCLPFYNYYMSRVTKAIREMEACSAVLLETYNEIRRTGA